MTLTSLNNFAEDFRPGDQFWHARGKTLTEFDNVGGTLIAMNTAQGHFNEAFMAPSSWRRRLVFGGITSSLVVGIAMQDTGENAIEELGLDNVRLPAPAFHGDTVRVRTRVLEVELAEGEPSGIVRFLHEGFNQDDVLIFEGERIVRIKARGEPGLPR